MSLVKEMQMAVFVSFVMGHDVFAILPTGYGKSLCYQCLPLPLLFDKVQSSEAGPSIVVVVTPLTAIMKTRLGIPSKDESLPHTCSSVRAQA